jgi:hypothetical protein
MICLINKEEPSRVKTIAQLSAQRVQRRHQADLVRRRAVFFLNVMRCRS